MHEYLLEKSFSCSCLFFKHANCLIRRIARLPLGIWIIYQPWWMVSGSIWFSLQWRHDEYHGVSNHRRLKCLLNRLFRRTSKKQSKPRATGLCGGIHQWPVDSPQNGPVRRKWFPFDDVITLKEHSVSAKGVENSSRITSLESGLRLQQEGRLESDGVIAVVDSINLAHTRMSRRVL